VAGPCGTYTRFPILPLRFAAGTRNQIKDQREHTTINMGRRTCQAYAERLLRGRHWTDIILFLETRRTERWVLALSAPILLWSDCGGLWQLSTPPLL